MTEFELQNWIRNHEWAEREERAFHEIEEAEFFSHEEKYIEMSDDEYDESN